MTPPYSPGVDPDDPRSAPWLAVIDMQKVFGEPGSRWFTPRFAETVGPIGELVAAFGPRVTFTRFIAPETPRGAWAKYYEQWPFALRPPESEIYRLVDEFAPGAGPTLDATTFGKWTPELAARVGDGGRLLLAGVSTDCCVLSTALAAADAGVEVQVVSDACAGVSDAAHLRALDVMRLYGPHIEVVTLAEVLSRYAGVPGADGLGADGLGADGLGADGLGADTDVPGRDAAARGAVDAATHPPSSAERTSS
ncbi:cysteine hydrolase family protein [Streptosporangium lutulentum]|uniref:Nicotinamidase-related amidase n=1 Tax=Streptosporangium lutulentum TaxID=1461250 RepID=A0ABT9QFQ6_9ACTN|nr:cysteine hydrolase [Streptosporangium lutulentum]MDP9845527.1 nicotinamidase-related amidase [Streptosporangium lutulentum]